MLLSKMPFTLWVFFPVAGLGMGLSVLVEGVLGFEPRTSPDWQFVPYVAMMVCALVATMLVGAQASVYSWMGRPWVLLPLLPGVVLGVVIGLAWVQGEPYLSIRDERLSSSVLLSCVLSGMIIMPFGILRAFWMLWYFASALTGWGFGPGDLRVRWALGGRGSARPCDFPEGDLHEQEPR